MPITKTSLYREIARLEGKKLNIDIAQISEIASIFIKILSKEKSSDVLKLLGH